MEPRDTERLIAQSTRGNYGLAKMKWTQQLAEIRGLPEARKP